MYLPMNLIPDQFSRASPPSGILPPFLVVLMLLVKRIQEQIRSKLVTEFDLALTPKTQEPLLYKSLHRRFDAELFCIGH